MTDSIIPRPAQNDNSLLGDPSDAMRDFFEQALRKVMQMEFDQHVGAGRYARSDERLDQRNGTRHRTFDTRMGSIDLAIPRLREGNYFPSFERRFNPQDGQTRRRLGRQIALQVAGQHAVR